MKKITLVVAALLVGFVVNAQFTINGEYRPRTEFLHGYKAPMVNSHEMFNLGTTQRARIGFFYNAEKYKFGMQFQDVRTWGAESQLVVADGATTTIHQAWGEVLFSDKFSLKLGRQELVYDDSRILGNVDWAQQARSHDLALFKYENKGAFSLHLGLAVNQVQTRAYNTPGNYKSMQFLWFNKKFDEDYTLSVLALNNGVEDVILNNPANKPMTTYTQIIGQHSEYKSGKFDVAINTYYQMGNDKQTYVNNKNIDEHKKMSAFDLSIDLGYKLNDNIKLRAGFEMLSGNSQTDTTASYNEVNHAFNPLYGTNHKFNGWMDYFYVGNHINNVGLNDLHFGFDYTKNKFIAGATFHYFMAGADVLDMDEFLLSGKYEAMSSGLGMELDTYVGYKYDKNVLFKAGVSGMFDTETMRAIKGGAYGASNYWGWVMVVIKPTFLNQ